MAPVVPVVTLFHTSDCHLCEEVQGMLEEMRTRFPFQIVRVDIADDPEAYRRYRHSIPVVWVDGEEVGRYPIAEATLAAALRRAASRP